MKLFELSPSQQAQIEISAKSDNVTDARLSDAQKAKQKETEIRDQQASDDPIDRKIAQLRQQIARLMQQKALKQAGK